MSHSNEVLSKKASPDKTNFSYSIYQYDIDKKVNFADKKTGEQSCILTSEKNSLQPWKDQIILSKNEIKKQKMAMLINMRSK